MAIEIVGISTFESSNTELTALLYEAELIKIHNPRHNTQLKKYGQTYFIRINKNEDYPGVEISAKFDFDGRDYFGPYSTKETVTNLSELINKAFVLRECDEKEITLGLRAGYLSIELSFSARNNCPGRLSSMPASSSTSRSALASAAGLGRDSLTVLPSTL